MIEIPKRVYSLEAKRLRDTSGDKHYIYTINNGYEDNCVVIDISNKNNKHSKLIYNYGLFKIYQRFPNQPLLEKEYEYVKDITSDKVYHGILDDSAEFVNGYKVVQMADGKYAYIREKDNLLLPYRYDVATNFNGYGYAIVGNKGRATWINKDFKYWYEEKWLKDNDFNGYTSVDNFTNIPLSRIKAKHVTFYMTDKGKIKTFKEYNGTNTYTKKKYFGEVSPFNNDGYAYGDDILLATGYFISKRNFLKMYEDSKLVEDIKIKTK